MKYLFVMDKYYPKPCATVICAQNVIDELIKQGHEVDIIAFRDAWIKKISRYNNCKIHYIDPDLRDQLAFFTIDRPDSKYAKIADFLSVLMNRIKKTIYFPWNPVYSFSFPWRLSRLINKLNDKNAYHAVISLYWPCESSLAAYWAKKRDKDINWIVYVIDPITNYNYRLLNKFGGLKRWFFKFARECDAYIYMRTNRKEYDTEQFQSCRNKLVGSDIPALILKNDDLRSQDNDITEDLDPSAENWVYTGSLNLPHYKCEDLIKIFMSLPKDKERVLHFFSKGAELEELRNKLKDSGRIIFHDYVPHDIIAMIYRNADVLVSMKYTGLISAKIFEYMSYGKTVLHISGCKTDPNAGYVKQYKKGIVLPVWKESIPDCVRTVLEETARLKDVTVDRSNDYAAFKKNMPSYTAELINKIASKKARH